MRRMVRQDREDPGRGGAGACRGFAHLAGISQAASILGKLRADHQHRVIGQGPRAPPGILRYVR
jgi:hypothetical protein